VLRRGFRVALHVSWQAQTSVATATRTHGHQHSISHQSSLYFWISDYYYTIHIIKLRPNAGHPASDTPYSNTTPILPCALCEFIRSIIFGTSSSLKVVMCGLMLCFALNSMAGRML
jgi:hypothetical protein